MSSPPLALSSRARHRRRSWVFRTVGYGHGELDWRRILSTLRLAGYDDVLSIEHEDPLIDSEEGFELAVGVLQKLLIRKAATPVWFEVDQHAD